MSQQINLFNPVFLNQRKYFSLLTMLQGLLLIVLGAGLFYGYAVHRVKSLNAEFDEVGKRYIDEQDKLRRYTAEASPQEAVQRLQNELNAVEARLAAQRELIATLSSGAIGNTTGYSEYMRAFARQTVGGLWLHGFSITEDATQMSVSGAVLSPDALPVFIRKLNQEPAMRGKSFASLQMQRGGNGGRAVGFTVQLVEMGGAAKQ